MPTLLFLIIVVLLQPWSTTLAFAEEIPDINLARGIFLYEGSQQWLNLAYDFSDSKYGQSSSTSQSFQESYNASLQMALFDPRIFDATMQGSVVFNQDKSSSDSSFNSNFNSWRPLKKPIPPYNTFQYNFSGSGLSRSRIPFTLLSFSNTNTVQNTYSTPTTSDNSGNEFGITFLNDKLQSNFNYSRNSTDTTVAGTTSSSVSNAYSYSAEHHYGAFSNTSLSAAFSDQSGGTSSGDKLTSSANSLLLSNSLRFGVQQNYSLLSSFQLNNSMTDNRPTRSLSFSESLGAALGRAMFFNASYSLTSNRNGDRTGYGQDDTTNQGEIGLTHQLFESLRTELHGTASLKKENDGTDNKYSVRGSATYNKNLSSGSHLLLVVDKGYDLNDRNVSSGMTTVRDELHVGVHQGDVIQLALSDGMLRSVSAVTSRNPIFTYVEGVDYTVNYALGRITILSGGGVRIDMDGTGTNLYLTYTLYQDPQLKYSTDSLSLSSGLTLFDNQVNLGAAWTKSGQTVISGPVVNTLQDSRSLMLYVGGNYDTSSVRFSYRSEVSGNLSSKSYEGNISTHWQTTNGTISLTARDSYNTYDATLTSVAYWDNNADMTISYSRNIMANTMLTLQGNANDSRYELQTTKDSLSLRANCQITLNMVSINLSGQTYWIFDQNGTSRNDSFHIDLTRYF
jgi:hypothetical protein